MELLWLRPLKGLFIFLTFCGIGIALQLWPSTGIVEQIKLLGVSTVFVTAAFLISGIMSLITGFMRWNWNALWIAVFIFYTITAWVSAIGSGRVPAAAPIAYSLLSAFLTFDVIEDLLRGRNGRNTKKW